MKDDTTKEIARGDFCARHTEQTDTAGECIARGLILVRCAEQGLLPHRGCWACALSQNELSKILAKAATIDAQAEAFGGTYTAGGMAYGRGEKP